MKYPVIVWHEVDLIDLRQRYLVPFVNMFVMPIVNLFIKSELVLHPYHGYVDNADRRYDRRTGILIPIQSRVQLTPDDNTVSYVSPTGDGKYIEGRADRREHLKRTGCREVDPSEFKPCYKNKRFAEKHKLQLTEE